MASQSTAEIDPYDRDTVAYLKNVGVEPALLGRVERLTQEVADLKAAPQPIDRDALIKAIDKAGSLKVGGTLWPLDRENVREIADAVLALLAEKASA